MTSSVEVLRPRDADEVAAVVASVFAAELAIARWLIPDDRAERERCLGAQFALLVRAVFDRDGRVQGIREQGRLVAVAVWSVHSGGEGVELPGYDRTLRAITGWHYPRFRALDDVFAGTAARVAHHHLGFLAATRRGAGLGGRLLSSYLGWIDRLPVRPMLTLDASNADAARFYTCHGFESRRPVEIPGSGGLQVFPMFRYPPARP